MDQERMNEAERIALAYMDYAAPYDRGIVPAMARVIPALMEASEGDLHAYGLAKREQWRKARRGAQSRYWGTLCYAYLAVCRHRGIDPARGEAQ